VAKPGDMRQFNGQNNRDKEDCPKGHPLFGDNLLTADLARGRRGCKICAYERTEARRRRLKAARDVR